MFAIIWKQYQEKKFSAWYILILSYTFAYEFEWKWNEIKFYDVLHQSRKFRFCLKHLTSCENIKIMECMNETL